jgi:hypothetical protein
MAKTPVEYKEVINGASEIYIGNSVSVTIPAGTKSGWLEPRSIEPKITPPSISGMTCVGWALYSTSTYRIQAPFVKRLNNDEWLVSCYLADDIPSTVNGYIFFRPLYIKS